MSTVMAVTFTRYGRLYYLDPGTESYRVGDAVLVPTTDGPEVATVVWAPTVVPDDLGSLPVCAGPATAVHLERDETNRAKKIEARAAARRLVGELDLPMKVVAVDVVDTRPDIDLLVIVYFTAPHRVDFRELVRTLASTVRARVDLRQVGARDDARLQGGIGPCGRDLCCATFLTDFEPVSARLAKDQDLPLNPLKIAGACGKLMCCLAYEHPLYTDFKRSAPRLGETVESRDGSVTGRVIGYNVPSGSVIVRDAESGRRAACPKADVCGSRAQFEASPAAANRPVATLLDDTGDEA
ncbi:MAG: regulatory iron-sulfur-containing complex subunit RicT [Jiangellales bacterium]